jgi:hypothetical protein
LSIAEKLLKDELSNKEASNKLVEKMLGDRKAKPIWQGDSRTQESGSRVRGDDMNPIAQL